MTQFEEIVANIKAEHARKKPIYDARPTKGERFAVPREGKEPVNVLLHRPSAPGPHAVLVNMHGGGFVGLDAVVLDDLCQTICDALGIFVVNVNYRLSPEAAYPYAAEEVCDVTDYFRAHAAEYNLDTEKFAVMGESAGSSLANSASLMLRDAGRPYACQVLIYTPPTLAGLPGEEQDPEEDSFRRLYCQHGEHRSLYVSPLLGTDEEVAGQCPTVFVTCEHDTLRRPAELYAKRLIDLGVPVAYKQFKGALHGFIEVCCGESFFEEDERKTPEQTALAREAEKFVCAQLRAFLDL